MKALLRSVRPLAASFAAASLGMLLTAQEPAPAAASKPDPAVADAIKEYKALLGDKKMEKDAEAIQVLDVKLLKPYATMHEKDQKDVVKVVGDTFKIRTRDPEAKGIYVAAAAALSQMKADGAKALVAAYNDNRFRKNDWVALRAEILKNIGRTKEKAHIDFLLDRALKDPEDTILAAAAQALGNFDDLAGKERKEIFEKLLKKYGEVEGNAKATLDLNDTDAETSRRRLQIITEDFNSTMAKMSRQNFRTAEEWNTWWNKNKNADWDKP